MRFNELILKKRDGGEFSNNEIDDTVDAILRGEIPDYQLGAWLMAIFFRGLSGSETVALTRAMWKSGETLPRVRRESEFWVDKHSTGGVGDKTSLILVPLVTVAAKKLFPNRKFRIPMISGRGLGFSGGTLDKMESVPGFNIGLDSADARSLLDEQGYFMLGQTAKIAPVDRVLYALRDVTATVECIPLIVASILSKKLSEHVDALVFDVKVGRGSFMSDIASASELANQLKEVAEAQGVRTTAFLTRMDEPLGRWVGHANEVKECFDFLGGRRESGLEEVVLALATEMLALSAPGESDRSEIAEVCRQILDEGTAAPEFIHMFKSQGGDWDGFSKNYDDKLGQMRVFEWGPGAGTVGVFDARLVAETVARFGGARVKREDKIDPWVGAECLKKVGDEIRAGEPAVRIYHPPGTGDQFTLTRELSAAIRLGEARRQPCIVEEYR